MPYATVPMLLQTCTRAYGESCMDSHLTRAGKLADFFCSLATIMTIITLYYVLIKIIIYFQDANTPF